MPDSLPSQAFSIMIYIVFEKEGEKKLINSASPGKDGLARKSKGEKGANSKEILFFSPRKFIKNGLD